MSGIAALLPIYIKGLLGGQMEFLSFLNDVNFTGIIQLALIAMIMLAGPVVIFLLAFRGGDL
jgi:hypothetical protein